MFVIWNVVAIRSSDRSLGIHMTHSLLTCSLFVILLGRLLTLMFSTEFTWETVILLLTIMISFTCAILAPLMSVAGIALCNPLLTLGLPHWTLQYSHTDKWNRRLTKPYWKSLAKVTATRTFLLHKVIIILCCTETIISICLGLQCTSCPDNEK